MDEMAKKRSMLPFGFGAADVFFILLAFFLIAHQPKPGRHLTQLDIPVVASDTPADTIVFSSWKVRIPKGSQGGISDTIHLIYNMAPGVDTFVTFEVGESQPKYFERIRQTFETCMTQVRDTMSYKSVDCFVWAGSYYFQVALVLKALTDLGYEPRLVYRVTQTPPTAFNAKTE